ncbi:MAG: hypothetical protein HYS12_28140 [Planctomycetes bacterium]|nr:hypothetical protein [Planctomycetota bacterium]
MSLEKKVILASLVLALLGRGGVHAQSPAGPPGDAGGAMVPDAAGGGAPPVLGSFHGPAGLSPWLIGPDRPDCCGPLSDRNPMRTELYLRSGVAIPTGNGPLGDSLDVGWAIQGGGRELFFNHAGDAAWTVDLGLTNIHNVADDAPATVTLMNIPTFDPTTQTTTVVPSVQATVRSLNRTYVNLGGGREWYLLGGAAGTRDTPNPTSWRIGIDGGGRWGTAKVDFFEIKHRTDTIAAVYVAGHTDLDIPCGCCIFQVGFRGEFDYTWSDILQVQNKSDVLTTNLMINLGVRY